MKPLDIFLLPGRYVLDLFFGSYLPGIDPTFITVIAGILSWIFWMALIRAAWAITLKLFGFGPRRV